MPSTTSGRTLNITRALCHSASERRNGNISHVPAPFRRKPEKRMISISCPCRGASVVSMPPSVPSQTTCQPAFFMYSATASPGNTCPPVPPAMMRMVCTKSPHPYVGPREQSCFSSIPHTLSLTADFPNQPAAAEPAQDS